MVLALALRLQPADQEQLHQVLARICRSGKPADSTGELPSLVEWLAEISTLQPWTQLQLVEEALRDCDVPHEIPVLSQHRQSLLTDHPGIAVRRSVADIVSRNPLGSAFGLVGLVGAIAVLARGAFRLLF